MPEKIVDQDIEETYLKLKEFLLRSKCTVTQEDTPKLISVTQGSRLGFSPRSAKKDVSYQLQPQRDGTRITAHSSVASDWTNLALYGTVFAGVLATICWLSANDLASYAVGTWSWSSILSSSSSQAVLLLISLMKILSVGLAIVMLVEVFVVFRVYRNIDTFAEDSFRTFSLP